jgi:alpha-D-xyloside xylohydrolase
MFENGDSRDVYLPPGVWVDYQTGKSYKGGWYNIKVGEIPIVMMVKDGTVLPHAKLAQTTKEIDWKELELRVYTSTGKASGKLFAPGDSKCLDITVAKNGNTLQVTSDPYQGKVKYKLK